MMTSCWGEGAPQGWGRGCCEPCARCARQLPHTPRCCVHIASSNTISRAARGPCSNSVQERHIFLFRMLPMQAATGVRRRAALRRRWRGVRELPTPGVVVLLVGAGALGGPEGPDHSTLAAVHRVAVAAAALGAATLLAVAAPEPLDAAAARRLAYSAGLHGRPGAVVSVPWLPGSAESGGGLAVGALQAAILAHASASVAGWGHPAPRARM